MIYVFMYYIINFFHVIHVDSYEVKNAEGEN